MELKTATELKTPRIYELKTTTELKTPWIYELKNAIEWKTARIYELKTATELKIQRRATPSHSQEDLRNGSGGLCRVQETVKPRK